MRSRRSFNRAEAREIRRLLKQKEQAPYRRKDRIRHTLRRRYSFFVHEFKAPGPPGFTASDFDELVVTGEIQVL